MFSLNFRLIFKVILFFSVCAFPIWMSMAMENKASKLCVILMILDTITSILSLIMIVYIVFFMA